MPADAALVHAAGFLVGKATGPWLLGYACNKACNPHPFILLFVCCLVQVAYTEAMAMARGPEAAGAAECAVLSIQLLQECWAASRANQGIQGGEVGPDCGEWVLELCPGERSSTVLPVIHPLLPPVHAYVALRSQSQRALVSCSIIKPVISQSLFDALCHEPCTQMHTHMCESKYFPCHSVYNFRTCMGPQSYGLLRLTYKPAGAALEHVILSITHRCALTGRETLIQKLLHFTCYTKLEIGGCTVHD